MLSNAFRSLVYGAGIGVVGMECYWALIRPWLLP